MAVENTPNTPARIGKSVVIRGEVKGSEDLFVDGRIEGTISLSESRLTIGPNAVLAADLTARDVLVLGQVQGNIIASGRVELRAGCSLIGDVRALRLAIEDNAIFRGKVDLTQGAGSGTVSGAPGKAGEPAQPAQTEAPTAGGLF
jgi:cytoskeletal protein CcmA (bactofilin family)